MDDIEEIAELAEQVIHRYSKIEKQERCYRGVTLTRAEIHTIVAIASSKTMNLTSLAEIRGITKGAMSQMVENLVRKDLVKKERSTSNQSEIVLTLTDKGKKAYAGHQTIHAKQLDIFTQTMMTLTDAERRKLKEILMLFSSTLEKLEEQK